MAGHPDDSNTKRPLVSVVIPVYNDAARLAGCLGALEKQTYPSDRVEILVVDNGSEDDVADAVDCFDNVRLLVELRPGSYAARNHGIREANGEVIAFTDADCVPASTWVERGVSHLMEDPAIGLVGGRIDVLVRDPENPNGVELADIVVNFQQRRYIEEFQFAATASAFSRKSVFERVGRFNEEMLSGGDRDWGERVANAGYRLRYADDAVITHPARRSLRQLYVKSKRQHAGARDHRRSTGSTLPVGQLLRSLVPPIGTAWRLRRDERIPSRWAWFRIVAVLSTMRLMRAWFTLRFAFGGSSPRQ